MENIQQTPDSAQPDVEKRPSFDQYLQQLPTRKQSIHRGLVWLIAIAVVLTLGVLVYAIYASIAWKSVGGSNVVLAWMYFFLAGAIAAFLLGLDTLVVGATIPPPFEGSKYNFQSGSKAVKEGWGLIGYGLVMTILVIVGVAGVRAGRFSVEDWVTFIVSVFVIIGVGSGLLAILRRIQRSIRT